jgi:hypothetical protein
MTNVKFQKQLKTKELLRKGERGKAPAVACPPAAGRYGAAGERTKTRKKKDFRVPITDHLRVDSILIAIK